MCQVVELLEELIREEKDFAVFLRDIGKTEQAVYRAKEIDRLQKVLDLFKKETQFADKAWSIC